MRKADSLARTWAYLVAAIILYLPANLLPVMHTSSLFGTSHDTIVSGVIYFWKSGSPELAVLIFTVSVVIPLAKMAALAWLAHRARRSPASDLHHLGHMYKVVELVGRWSMLDVFVVALMVGMVRFKTLATIEAGSGAAAFGAVVVLGMLAANSFDPRLLWDNNGRSDNDP
jgi:paraquat-inducible protein A